MADRQQTPAQAVPHKTTREIFQAPTPSTRRGPTHFIVAVKRTMFTCLCFPV